jgi:hypothetical protein
MNIPKIRTRALGGACIAVTLSLFAVSCGGGDSAAQPETSELVEILTPSPGAETPLPRRTATPTPAPTPSPLKVCAPNPDPAPAKFLQVLEPLLEQQVKIPFHLRGWGSNIGQDNRGVAVGIVDARQTVVQVLNLPPQPNTYRLPPPDLERNDNTRPFAADIVITGITAPTPYCLWIYQQTTPEGRPQGVVQVPIVVVP